MCQRRPEIDVSNRQRLLIGSALPFLALGVLVAGGFPLFLGRGQTVDSLFFDVCAQVVLRGKRVYDELFLHGPPGMIWAYSAVRGAFGWRVETLRAVDIIIVMLTLGLCVSLGLPLSGQGMTRIWTFAVLLGFYLSTTEWCHCETDVWMFLPAMTALWLRIRRIEKLEAGARTAPPALFEGAAWGIALVMKPHVIIPAAFSWLATLTGLRHRHASHDTVSRPCHPTRQVMLDLAGLIAGGILIGLLTLTWFVTSGNWKGFLDALSWNKDYLAQRTSLVEHYQRSIEALWPWSLVQLAAIPAAVHAIARAWTSRGRDEGTARSVMAAAYLGFVLEANLLQQQFDYHLVPVVFLGIAFMAGERRPGPYVLLGLIIWLISSLWLSLATAPSDRDFWRHQCFLSLGSALLILPCCLAGRKVLRPVAVLAGLGWLFLHHPLLDAQMQSVWVNLWKQGSTPEIRNALNQGDQSAVDYVAMARVADYLRSRHVQDRQLLCYSFSALPLYTQLHVQPATRFVLLWTVFEYFPHHRDEIARALAQSPMRFVVNDFEINERTLAERGLQSLNLDGDSARGRPQFPWSEPIVFREGKYRVYEVRPRRDR
jgi:hypothetical protein